MSEDPVALVGQYARRGVFVDSNLLLLWFIGATDPRLIRSFKRTRTFCVEDFQTLDGFLGEFRLRVTTPNVLTEVSNLANSLTGSRRIDFARVFSVAVASMNEDYVQTSSLVDDTDKLARFGVTDCGIMSMVRDKYLLLTDDLKLSQYFVSQGGDSINFNHIRQFGW